MKKGYKKYKDLLDATAEYLGKTKVVKWTRDEVKKFDDFLDKHPKTRDIGGVVVGLILIYMWFTMSFTGDFQWDFDMSDVIEALSGQYSLADLFLSPDGIKSLVATAVGTMTELSFPWPSPQTIQFIFSVLLTLGIEYNIQIRKKKMHEQGLTEDQLENAL